MEESVELTLDDIFQQKYPGLSLNDDLAIIEESFKQIWLSQQLHLHRLQQHERDARLHRAIVSCNGEITRQSQSLNQAQGQMGLLDRLREVLKLKINHEKASPALRETIYLRSRLEEAQAHLGHLRTELMKSWSYNSDALKRINDPKNEERAQWVAQRVAAVRLLQVMHQRHIELAMLRRRFENPLLGMELRSAESRRQSAPGARKLHRKELAVDAIQRMREATRKAGNDSHSMDGLMPLAILDAVVVLGLALDPDLAEEVMESLTLEDEGLFDAVGQDVESEDLETAASHTVVPVVQDPFEGAIYTNIPLSAMRQVWESAWISMPKSAPHLEGPSVGRVLIFESSAGFHPAVQEINDGAAPGLDDVCYSPTAWPTLRSALSQAEAWLREGTSYGLAAPTTESAAQFELTESKALRGAFESGWGNIKAGPPNHEARPAPTDPEREQLRQQFHTPQPTLSDPGDSMSSPLFQI